LAVRTPSAAFRRSCETVQETVLLLVLIRTHRFPRLFAEVPDGLPNGMGRTNAPHAIDQFVRLLVPAVGLRLVLLPFLRGPALGPTRPNGLPRSSSARIGR
jgi:hypothetical protein